MSIADRPIEHRIAEAFADEVPSRAPVDLADAVLATTAGSRPRPRWATWLRESSMAFDGRAVFGSAPARSAGIVGLSLLLLALAVSTAVVGANLLRSPAPLIPPDRGVFTPTGSLEFGRENPSATLLGDGRLVVMGGYGGRMDGPGTYRGGTEALSSIEIWDPTTGEFSTAGDLLEARSGHVAVLLQDGRVLVAGGGADEDDATPTSAEIWDPATGVSTPTGSLAQARSHASAMLLSDGRVLIKGGLDDDPGAGAAEIWDPATGLFGPGETVPEASYPEGTILDDGRVLVLVDGPTEAAASALRPGAMFAAIWDPATGTFLPAGSLIEPHGGGSTATRLADGRVLVVGGMRCPRRGGCQIVRAAEVWDPSTMTFESTSSPGWAHEAHRATLLPDGRVLFVGSQGLGGRTNAAEIFELR